MPTFKKKIVRPDVYDANAIFEGKRKITALSRNKLRSIAKTANEMISEGLKIPAPLAHKIKKNKDESDTVIPHPVTEDDYKDSGSNAGYWKRFELDETDGGLVGYVEVPDEEIAKKVGKTITETSIMHLPRWTDGSGKTWEDVLWHVSLQDAHSIEGDQENFEPTEDAELSLAMAISMADVLDQDKENPSKQNKDSGKAISSIIQLLEEKLEITLPSDTNEGNFLDRLLTALTTTKSKEEDEEFTQQPENTVNPTSPIAMADKTTTDQDVANEVIEKKQSALIAHILKQTKADLTSRIQALLKGGIIGKKIAEDWTQRTEAIAMSFDDLTVDDEGNVKAPEFAIAMAVDAMESEGVSVIDPDITGEEPADSEELTAEDDPEVQAKKDDEAGEEWLSNITGLNK